MSSDKLYLHILYQTNSLGLDTSNPIYYYSDTVTLLNDYYNTYNYDDGISVSYINVKQSELSIDFKNDVTYIFVLSSSASSLGGAWTINPLVFSLESVFDVVQFTVGGLTDEDIANNRYNNLINSMNKTDDAIKDVNNTMKDTSDKLFSDEYDESQIQISTETSDSVDGSSITNFVTTLLQNIQNIATGNWNSVETINIPLGFVDENIEFRSDLMSSHIPQPLQVLINVFWMYLFGMYIYKYTSKLIDWLKSGDVLNNKEMSANEVITSSML